MALFETLTLRIELLTPLHIGGHESMDEQGIGIIDKKQNPKKPVRNFAHNGEKYYIPASSLKGVFRTLALDWYAEERKLSLEDLDKRRVDAIQEELIPLFQALRFQDSIRLANKFFKQIQPERFWLLKREKPPASGMLNPCVVFMPPIYVDFTISVDLLKYRSLGLLETPRELLSAWLDYAEARLHNLREKYKSVDALLTLEDDVSENKLQLHPAANFQLGWGTGVDSKSIWGSKVITLKKNPRWHRLMVNASKMPAKNRDGSFGRELKELNPFTCVTYQKKPLGLCKAEVLA